MQEPLQQSEKMQEPLQNEIFIHNMRIQRYKNRKYHLKKTQLCFKM